MGHELDQDEPQPASARTSMLIHSLHSDLMADVRKGE